MSAYPYEAAGRATEYCQRRRLTREQELGWGQDGVVFSTTRRLAVKAFRYEKQYRNELAVYQRLQAYALTEAAGFSIPRLIDAHDELLIIEVSIVQPPYAIEFAAAYLDRPPDFPADIMEEYEREREELFGEDWPRVRLLRSSLRRIGIHLTDLNPRNIAVG